MNLHNKTIAVFYNLSTIVILLLGVTYIYMGEISMGFARDLVYRESIIEESLLVFLNSYFFALFWTLVLCVAMYKMLKYKLYTITQIINLCAFVGVIVASFLFYAEYVMLFTVLNVFASMRLVSI